MFYTSEDFKQYVEQSFLEVTDSRIDNDHWDLLCTRCRVARGFQLIKRNYAVDQTKYLASEMFTGANTYEFRCPVCNMFKQWIIYKVERQGTKGWVTHYYRVASVPNEGLEEIEELPLDPPALRIAYREAVRCMDANAPMASAAMFRRALQIITRNLLGAKPGNLANELNAVVGKTFNGITITDNFASIGYVIKEAGNQGAHPDADPDLINFTLQDAQDLQRIFMEIVSELFIIPAATKKARADFLARRKIDPS